mmetsp:Transcript_43806/g.115860  ORF Transcript_43806/g.115860 Transcript_43806/m.115860 type:complete len:230 (+) Transcript_43806:108-797(+)
MHALLHLCDCLRSLRPGHLLKHLEGPVEPRLHDLLACCRFRDRLVCSRQVLLLLREGGRKCHGRAGIWPCRRPGPASLQLGALVLPLLWVSGLFLRHFQHNRQEIMLRLHRLRLRQPQQLEQLLGHGWLDPWRTRWRTCTCRKCFDAANRRVFLTVHVLLDLPRREEPLQQMPLSVLVKQLDDALEAHRIQRGTRLVEVIDADLIEVVTGNGERCSAVAAELLRKPGTN